jgi:RimJ/RimL family protein N-acetyltransferase
MVPVERGHLAPVEIRPYRESDRGLTLALEADPNVVGHLGGPVDEAAAERVHENRLAGVAGGDLIYTIIPETGAEPIGVIAIWRSEWQSRPIHEIGVMLLPQYQSRAFAFRAYEQLRPLARERGITELHAFPSVSNKGSNLLLRRVRYRRLEDCDLDYEGRPLRCAHWIGDLRG